MAFLVLFNCSNRRPATVVVRGQAQRAHERAELYAVSLRVLPLRETAFPARIYWRASVNALYEGSFVTSRTAQLAAWGAVRRTGKREALRRLELLG